MIDAVRTGAGSLAVGNIAGTNVANLLLILGLSAAIRPLASTYQPPESVVTVARGISALGIRT